MPAIASISIDDDLASGEAAIAMRAADHETTGRINVEDGELIEIALRDGLLDQFLDD